MTRAFESKVTFLQSHNLISSNVFKLLIQCFVVGLRVTWKRLKARKCAIGGHYSSVSSLKLSAKRKRQAPVLIKDNSCNGVISDNHGAHRQLLISIWSSTTPALDFLFPSSLFRSFISNLGAVKSNRGERRRPRRVRWQTDGKLTGRPTKRGNANGSIRKYRTGNYHVCDACRRIVMIRNRRALYQSCDQVHRAIFFSSNRNILLKFARRRTVAAQSPGFLWSEDCTCSFELLGDWWKNHFTFFSYSSASTRPTCLVFCLALIFQVLNSPLCFSPLKTQSCDCHCRFKILRGTIDCLQLLSHIGLCISPRSTGFKQCFAIPYRRT